jgi:hypothetical protein
VTRLDHQHGMVTVSGHPAGGGGRPIELSIDALWLLTTQTWDQVWYWPDRAGERFDAVRNRFVAAHPPGDVVTGYFLDTGIGASNLGFVAPNPKTAMQFEIQRPTPGLGQVRVRPVAATADGVVTVGPNVPLRIGMTCYRWSLSFGEIILNWPDFLRPEGD